MKIEGLIQMIYYIRHHHLNVMNASAQRHSGSTGTSTNRLKSPRFLTFNYCVLSLLIIRSEGFEPGASAED